MLHNTYYRLTKDKKLRLGFFGGSVTDGTGASDAEKTSYRAIITDWFRTSFPDAEITSVNASIGGTGTGYGMFRCERDLLSHDPDIVFFEYAGNDFEDSYDNVLPRAETIFRKIRRLKPFADVIALFDVYDDVAADIERGREHEARSAITTAAHRYNIPVINMGAVLHAKILRSGGVFADFIPDTQHPNDAGHKIMGECVTGFLKSFLDEEKNSDCTLLKWDLPSPICENVLDDARMTYCTELENLELSGFEFTDSLSDDRFSKYLEAKHVGDSFSFTFCGKGVGICWGSANINGDVDVQIDDGEPIRVKSWDNYVRSFHRMASAIVTTSLDPDKTHRVTITIAAFNPTEISPDKIDRIGAIFMC